MATGVTLPTAVIGLIYVARKMAQIRSKKKTRKRRAEPEKTRRETYTTSRPVPTEYHYQRDYVPYENDSHAVAYDWAARQIASKYPGAVELVQTLDSLIKQHQNASEKSHAPN